MTTWRKVTIGGSDVQFAQIKSSTLNSTNLVLVGEDGTLEDSGLNINDSFFDIGGKSIISSGSFSILSGSFSGSFIGNFNLSSLKNGRGISPFTYDGSREIIISISGSNNWGLNRMLRWDGYSLVNSSLFDNGNIISGPTSIQLRGRNSSLTGSFSGSLHGGEVRFEPILDPDPSGSNLTSTVLFQSASNTDLGYDLYIRQDGNLTKWKWIEGSLESGLLYGGVITYSGSNIFVSPGSGLIINHNASTGSEIGPIIDYITWGPITQSVTNITSSQVTYLYINDSGNLQQQSTRFTSEQYHNYIPLGAVGHFDYTQINAFGGSVRTAYDQVSQISDFIDAFGPLKISGYGITGQSGSLQLSISSGTSFIHGGFYKESPEFPSNITTTDQLTASIAYVHQSGSRVIFDTNNNSLYTSIRPGFYDLGDGTTGSLSNNNWTIQRVFSDPKTGILYVYYGQNIYPNYTDAVGALSSDSFTEGDTFDFTTFIGYLILKSNTIDIINPADNKIIPAGLFRGISGGGSGGGSNAQALDDLTDVAITSPINGQTIVYNSGIWENGYPSTASYSYTSSYVNPLSQDLLLTGSLRISGSVGIGLPESGIFGRIDALNDVVAFSTSDLRFKENIIPINNALNKIDKIQGYEFDWIDNNSLYQYHGFKGHDIGIIAQEIEQILPDIVITKDTGYKAVKYEKIVPFLIQCIKELKQEINELKIKN